MNTYTQGYLQGYLNKEAGFWGSIGNGISNAAGAVSDGIGTGLDTLHDVGAVTGNALGTAGKAVGGGLADAGDWYLRQATGEINDPTGAWERKARAEAKAKGIPWIAAKKKPSAENTFASLRNNIDSIAKRRNR